MKWEYKTIHFSRKKFITSSLDTALIDEKLNSYSDNGWELVTFEIKTTFIGIETGAYALLKRAKG
ncbi:MAG: DUF4177 domain-containing protein [Desulfobacteraceae bacterium]|nr:DUF4177 domain-containing protein [Desulfobacteraceae bacterium]MBU4054101.1 DUF4177 domain-containing protein [Pseudomonadota bacterium]